CIRDFWRGADSMLSEFAERFTGSSDLYKNDYRRPTASINFITAHDGFTLNDMVSYNDKHNEANGEESRDGEDHNRSYNFGVEGPTEDPEINAQRKRQQRNLLTTLFLSQGVPMLVAGDELSRTQHGNNNAYCQDNELSWINWERADEELLDFTRMLIHFYKTHPVFSRRRWFKGLPIKGVGLEDIAWFAADGTEMSEENWNQDFAKSLGVYLNGKGIRSVDEKGATIVDDSFYIIFNAFEGQMSFKLPTAKFGSVWEKVIDTNESRILQKAEVYDPGTEVSVEGRSVVVLKNPLNQK
ncbi:MAG TPA: glycogen debranching enzyme GlgX, partial [Flavisolibacter sp.]